MSLFPCYNFTSKAHNHQLLLFAQLIRQTFVKKFLEQECSLNVLSRYFNIFCYDMFHFIRHYDILYNIFEATKYRVKEILDSYFFCLFG